jgi:hypothetical protein
MNPLNHKLLAPTSNETALSHPRVSQISTYSDAVHPWGASEHDYDSSDVENRGVINSSFSHAQRQLAASSDGLQMRSVGRHDSSDTAGVKRKFSTVVANTLSSSVSPIPGEVPEEWSCAYLGWILAAFITIFLLSVWVGSFLTCSQNITIVDLTFALPSFIIDDENKASNVIVPNGQNHKHHHHNPAEQSSQIYQVSFNPGDGSRYICGSWMQQFYYYTFTNQTSGDDFTANEPYDDVYLDGFELFTVPCLLPKIHHSYYNGQFLPQPFKSEIVQQCQIFFNGDHKGNKFSQTTPSCINTTISPNSRIVSEVSVAYLSCTPPFTSVANAL